MIDFHAHILPCIDDGSQSVEESVSLIDMLASQEVDRVFATPHFMIENDTAECFIEKRNEAYESLQPHLTSKGIDVRLGAEVAYFPGVSGMSSILDLRLQGTKLLLLEMPNAPWSEYTVRELLQLSCTSDIKLMLAHVERCMDFQSKKTWQRLLDGGVIMQSNASFFIDPRVRRKALKLLLQGKIHVLGSDCHNLEYRPPRMLEAIEIIGNRYGEDVVSAIDRFSQKIT